ncbi:hypothetical protein EVAR_20698_1 [Eumeta japonica]|uniref:Pre-C2HC domain-containing protein n=1 Tax=Eumeta variegata TaxID=151549 RepID=A0A4C1VCI4_EUMVA|nr:hypothetical protein EVAR_20698_1 [Eumeta japonica]
MNRNRETLDLVLVSVDPSTKDNVKAIFFNIKTACLLSEIKMELPHKKSTPGQCHNCQLYDHSSKNCFSMWATMAQQRALKQKNTRPARLCSLAFIISHATNFTQDVPRFQKYPHPYRNSKNKNNSQTDTASSARARGF